MSLNQINNVSLKETQKSSPSFRSKLLLPKQALSKDSLKILGLASSAVALAGIAMQKKTETKTLPTEEELLKMIEGMKLKNGKARFSREGDISFVKQAYAKDPELTLRILNMKNKDGGWLINYGWDFFCAVDRYKLHPNFSEKVFKDAQEKENPISAQIFFQAAVDSDEEDFLFKFYDYKDKDGTPHISYTYVPLFIEYYKDEPDFFEKMLSAKDSNSEYACAWNEHGLVRLYKSYKEQPELVSSLIDVVNGNGKHLSENQIERFIDENKEERDGYIELYQMKDSDGNRFNLYEIDRIQELKTKDPETVTKIINIKDFSGKYAIRRTYYIEQIANIEDKNIQKNVIELVEQGVDIRRFEKFLNSPCMIEVNKLAKQGVSINKIIRALEEDKLEKLKQEAQSKTSALKEFFSSPDYMKQIRDNSGGKYQKELMEFFDLEKMPNALKSALFDSRLSVEDFLASLKKISKSSFKLAYDTPNQYVDGLDSSLSTPVNGHYPKLSDEDMALQRQKVLEFFVHNMEPLARGLKYIDVDTMNHLMDKRFNIFSTELATIDNAPDEYLERFVKLSQCKSNATGKPLSVKEKMAVYDIIKIFSSCKFDIGFLDKSIENNSVNIKEVKKFIYNETLKKLDINIDIENLDENKKFNEDYVHLTLSTQDLSSLTREEQETLESGINITIKNFRKKTEEAEKEKQAFLESVKRDLEPRCSDKDLEKVSLFINMYNNIDNYSDDELKEIYKEIYALSMSLERKTPEIQTLVKEATLGNFEDFINNPNNKYGKANIRTKEIFEEKNLSFEQWLVPDIPNVEFSVGNKNLKIRLWDRNPYEDLFMGNKTTCCTAIGRTNAGATPIYIMSHCWNVVQIFDEKGDVVGMSRIFIGESNGEYSVMMDNIELNNKLVANMTSEDRQKIRNKMFEYMHSLAEKVTGNPNAKVYFYTGDTHVPTYDLERCEMHVDFIGKNPTEEVYINSNDLRWGNPEKFKEKISRWFIIPKQ